MSKPPQRSVDHSSHLPFSVVVRAKMASVLKPGPTSLIRAFCHTCIASLPFGKRILTRKGQ